MADKTELTLDDLMFAFDLEPEEAITYFESLGIEVSANWKETLQIIQKGAFAISGVKNMEHLIDAKETIQNALENGLTWADVKKTFNEDMKLRSWHAQLVVSQNISNSMNAGRYKQQMETQVLIPYIRPVIMDDSKTTSICKNLKALNIAIPKGDEGLKKMYAPRHFRCRTVWMGCTKKFCDANGIKIVGVSSLPEDVMNLQGFDTDPASPYEPDMRDYPPDLVKEFKKVKGK